jgi:hypothetical protein
MPPTARISIILTLILHTLIGSASPTEGLATANSDLHREIVNRYMAGLCQCPYQGDFDGNGRNRHR